MLHENERITFIFSSHLTNKLGLSGGIWLVFRKKTYEEKESGRKIVRNKTLVALLLHVSIIIFALDNVSPYRFAEKSSFPAM